MDQFNHLKNIHFVPVESFGSEGLRPIKEGKQLCSYNGESSCISGSGSSICGGFLNTEDGGERIICGYNAKGLNPMKISYWELSSEKKRAAILEAAEQLIQRDGFATENGICELLGILGKAGRRISYFLGPLKEQGVLSSIPQPCKDGVRMPMKLIWGPIKSEEVTLSGLVKKLLASKTFRRLGTEENYITFYERMISIVGDKHPGKVSIQDLENYFNVRRPKVKTTTLYAEGRQFMALLEVAVNDGIIPQHPISPALVRKLSGAGPARSFRGCKPPKSSRPPNQKPGFGQRLRKAWLTLWGKDA